MTICRWAALKRPLLGLALCVTYTAACVGAPRPAAPGGVVTVVPLSVMTFNLRYAHSEPPNLWPDRLPVVSDLIERRHLDVIGTQEGLYHQIRDLDTSLPAYEWLGTGRDGGSKGEFMAVFYRRDRLEPLEFDNYWLSDTPAIAGSRTWGNNYPRMVTWVRFRDRVHGGEFLFVNTHLDHEVQASRERSAALILERLAATPSAVPVILVGDFNAGAGGNPVYSRLTGPGGFTDTWVAASNPDTLGTFHGFKGVAAALAARRIDWILVRGPAAVLSSEIITDARGGQLPSDHFPVVARVRLTSTTPAPAAR